jgi:hypothetical protein
VGKGAFCTVPTSSSSTTVVGTLRFAHPTLLAQKTAAGIAADGRSPAKTEPLILDI